MLQSTVRYKFKYCLGVNLVDREIELFLLNFGNKIEI